MDRSKERRNNRLKYYDYSKGGYYFMTICTKNRVEYFGRIQDEKMELSEIGEIANQCWREIPKHFLCAELDEYIIMPNHIHGIIIINNNYTVRNAHVRSVQEYDRSKMTLSKIIHGFKSSVTRKINRTTAKISFQWQKSFYDHIIRNEHDLSRVHQYIRDNHLKWELGRNYPANL